MLANQFVYFPWWCMNVNTLNPEYFNVYEQPLRVINTSIDSTLLSSIDSCRVSVELLSTRFSSGKKKVHSRVKLNNVGRLTINSGLDNNSALLEYNWMQNGNLVQPGGSVPLLADLLPGSLKQIILLDIPPDAGSYDLAFYIVINGNEKVMVDLVKSINVD
jgi:hypothetical protein